MSLKNIIKNKIPDAIYIFLLFRKTMGYYPNLIHPQTFNEKIQWLKLYDRNPLYTNLVDKNEVKKYVAGIIGHEYIIKTLGVWDSFDDIDFSSLPNRFVLKCTHDSGSICIIRDKELMDKSNLKRVLTNHLKCNHYYFGREWPYKNVIPKILAEEYLCAEPNDRKESEGIKKDTNESLIDYKFFCFNGEPRFLYISQGLEDHSTASISFVSLDWRKEPFFRIDYKQFDYLPPIPSQFDNMINISKKLSKGFKFIRVDLYEINERIYFSELTLHPCSGFIPFNEYKYDVEIGQLLRI